MKLTIRERLYLLQLLPPTGNYDKLCIVEGMYERVKLSTEEEKKYGIRQTQQGLAIDPKHENLTFDYEFSEKETAIIEEELRALEKMNNLNIGNMSLYKMFIADKKKN